MLIRFIIFLCIFCIYFLRHSLVLFRLAGRLWGGSPITLSDITLDHVQTENRFDFKDNFEDDIFTDIQHSCDYLDPNDLNIKLQGRGNSSLSYYSHNIRSLPGHWNDHKELLSTIYENTSFKFSCIALHIYIYVYIYK